MRERERGEKKKKKKKKKKVSYAAELDGRQLDSKVGQLAKIACNMILELGHDDWFLLLGTKQQTRRGSVYSPSARLSPDYLLPSPTTIDDSSSYKGTTRSDGSVVNDNGNKINKEEEAAQLIRKSDDGLSKYPDYYGTNVRHVSTIALEIEKKKKRLPRHFFIGVVFFCGPEDNIVWPEFEMKWQQVRPSRVGWRKFDLMAVSFGGVPDLET